MWQAVQAFATHLVASEPVWVMRGCGVVCVLGAGVAAFMAGVVEIAIPNLPALTRRLLFGGLYLVAGVVVIVGLLAICLTL